MADAASGANAPEALQMQVVLASASPRRKQLLADAGVKARVLVPAEKVDEALSPDELAIPAEAAKKLAEKKAGAAVQELLATGEQGMFAVIGADTMVVKDAEVFGKPRNLEDAKRMLRELSGCTHQVITGVSLWMLLVGEGDEVEIFGPHNSVNEAAKLAGTISYELTCAVSKRVPRIYRKGGREIARELLLRG